MVTITARNGVSLSRNSSENGFPPATVARKFKTARHLGDFAESDIGRARRQERRQRRAERFAYLDSRD